MTSIQPCLYQTKNSNTYVTCTLCPHYCRLAPGDIGRCRARFNSDGVLMTTNYGKVVSFAWDPIEKKPLNHFYPGHQIFSIGTTGCNLTCDFCQNHELVHYQGDIPSLSPNQIINLAKTQDTIGIAFTYNEPTIWFETVLDVSKLAKEHGLKTVWVTNGFINEAPLMEILPYIDAMNIDLKAFSNTFYQSICGGMLEPVCRTIELAHNKTHIEVTTLLIDGLNTDLNELHALCKWLAGIDPNIPLHLNRYFPAYKMNRPKTLLDTLRKARDVAKLYLSNVHVGNCFLDD